MMIKLIIALKPSPDSSGNPFLSFGYADDDKRVSL